MRDVDKEIEIAQSIAEELQRHQQRLMRFLLSLERSAKRGRRWEGAHMVTRLSLQALSKRIDELIEQTDTLHKLKGELHETT